MPCQPVILQSSPYCDNDSTSLLQVLLDDHTCEAQIVIPLDTPTLLMQELAERVAVSTMLRDTPGKCFGLMLTFLQNVCQVRSLSQFGQFALFASNLDNSTLQIEYHT